MNETQRVEKQLIYPWLKEAKKSTLIELEFFPIAFFTSWLIKA